MFPNITMPLVILVVWAWVAMVQSECITNPMDEINRKAKEQYQTTDKFLDKMEKSTPIKYQNLLRMYGVYRACMESGTQRWTDHVGKDSCPYCRDKIEKEDKNSCDKDEINQCGSQFDTMMQHILKERKEDIMRKNMCKYFVLVSRIGREFASCLMSAILECGYDIINNAMKAVDQFNNDPFNCDLTLALSVTMV